jgi:tyrosine aminotransferase
VDENTVALVINNPSNPCGSNWSKEHVARVMGLAAELCLPVVADEVYGRIVFGGAAFTSAASVSSEAPVFSIGSLSKQFVAPGWRLGWIALHDPK